MPGLPNKNARYTVRIDGLDSEGNGTGRIDGFTVFIPGALPGETVLMVAVKVKKTYGYGKLLEIITPSAARRKPFCGAFGKCGGCALQHMDYAAQLEYKRKKVADDLKRIGGVDCEVLSTLGMESPVRYRNKAQFPVGKSQGGLSVGFFAPRSHRIIPLEDCALQAPVNGRILAAVKNFLLKNNIAPYDEEGHTGLVRHVLTRIGHATGEAMACLVINGDNLPRSAELVSALRGIDGMASVAVNINKRRTNVIMGERTETLYGGGYITDIIGGAKFRISPKSFFQVNTPQAAALYEAAAEMARLSPSDTVIDAYCGTGSISLYIAGRVKEVWGVEIVPEAIEDARHNAGLNGIANAKFVLGSAEAELDGLAARVRPDVIFLDPPRKGCDAQVLRAAAGSGASRVVYISCDPATLARDVKVLAGEGLCVERVQPVDMFCMTPHVEACVLLTQKNPQASPPSL